MLMAKNLHTKLVSIVTNRYFELFMMSIIILSALLIGIHTFKIEPIYKEILMVMDTFITIIFIIEIAMRIASYEKPLDFFKDGWNLFDFIIVTLSLIPIESNHSAVARLLRIFRILRLITILPELKIIINALFKSSKAIGYVMILMFIIFYIFAIIGTVLFESAPSGLWSNIGIALLTLFRIMTFEGWSELLYESMKIHSWSWIFYLSFIFLSAFTFLNMIIGIILDTLNAEHKKENIDAGVDEVLLISQIIEQNKILIEKVEHLEKKFDER